MKFLLFFLFLIVLLVCMATSPPVWPDDWAAVTKEYGIAWLVAHALFTGGSAFGTVILAALIEREGDE